MSTAPTPDRTPISNLRGTIEDAADKAGLSLTSEAAAFLTGVLINPQSGPITIDAHQLDSAMVQLRAVVGKDDIDVDDLIVEFFRWPPPFGKAGR